MLLLFIVLLVTAFDVTFGRHFVKTNSDPPKFLSLGRHIPPSTRHANILPSNGEQSLCTEAVVSFTFIDYDGEFANLTASAHLKYYSEFGDDFLEVSNATGWDSSQNTNMSYICYDDVNGFGCNMNLTTSYRFTLDKGDPFIDIDGYFSEMPTYITQIYLGYANNGTLSNMDGTLFNSNNPCDTYYFDSSFETVNMTTCCTNLIPAPEIPSNSSRCKRFRSRTTLYNNDYSIHATSAMNYTLNGKNQIITQGDFSAPNDTLFVTYYFTGEKQCDSQNSPTLSCTIDLPQYDSKTIIQMNFWNETTGINIPVVGMFLIRNDQTLIYEGIPFSPKNDCVYYTYDEHDNWGKPTATEFCCKEFE